MNSVSFDVYMGLVYSVDAASEWKELESTYDKYVRSALLTRDHLPEVKDSYTTVSREESYKGILESSNVTESKINATSFAVKGANQHLTWSTVGMLNVVDISNLKITEGHPNGTFAISHVGNLKLTSNVILYDVLVVLGYCVSLLYVNKLIKYSKLFVGFDEEKCYIQNLKKKITLRTGSESDGLYLFDMEPDNTIGKANLIFSCNVSKDLWHNRLGHPADQVLNVLKKDLNLTKSTSVSACEVCYMAKQTRDPFPLSHHKSEKLGEIIHLDLWGPYRFTSREGFKYSLTIFDDFSRAVWIYLIKTKDEVFEVFVRFVKMIHNQFDVKIKTVRLPTSILNGKSPYELVHGNKPNFSHLRSFGCLCFSTILNNNDKFTSREVNFYETEFPFKMRNKSLNDVAIVDFTNEADHLTFFDNQLTQSSYDEGRVTLVEESSPTFSNTYTTQHYYMRMGSVQNKFKRSSRVSKLSAKLNDYVIDSKLKYGLEKHVSYAKLNSVNYCFATTLNKKAIGSKCIFKIKYKASGEIERYKARLVAKSFRQREGFDYDETFSLVVKMVTAKPKAFGLVVRKNYRSKKLVTVRCMITIAVMNGWSLYQLDINNVFLYGDLVDDVYMDLPLGYDQGSSGKSKFDYSLYTKESGNVFLALLVYVDDIVITSNCKESIDQFKLFLKNKFMIKDLGILKYFLAKPATTLIPKNNVLSYKESENDKFLSNITEYQKLMGKLIYLTHIRPDISYVVQCLSQYMHAPLQSHFKVAMRVFSKKQPTISRSSAKAEYRCLAASTCEVIWIFNVLSDLKVTGLFPVDIFYDSSSAIQIASCRVKAQRLWNAKSTAALVEHRFVQSKFDYSLYTKESGNVFLALLVYVEGHRAAIIVMRKYCLELLHEYGLLVAKPTTTLIPENNVLSYKESENDKFLSNITEVSKIDGSLLRSYALSWKPYQGDSLNLPDHRIHKNGDGDALFQLKSDSLPHAHAQTTKTYYKCQYPSNIISLPYK
ncbi:ribonuclease H-like domain-containing protein [Tanacetum coccineum]|uniref:Ribonuclease H-like domain-containing protein n=1 Tax=Tanacetum coccineum TaxID=301880 RepID=A0ABQ5BZ92_9ASTR